jgi:hypothetical protein
LYSGQKIEYQNKRESFRRNEANKDKEGNIIGWHGTRGKHTITIAEYITINRDEFPEIKTVYNKLKDFNEKNDVMFWNDLLFSKLKYVEKP